MPITMKKNVVCVPTGILVTLRANALRIGDTELDDVIKAAIWAFSRQDAARQTIAISDYWFGKKPLLDCDSCGEATLTEEEP